MSSFAFFVHFFPVLLDRKKLRTPSSHVGPGSIFQANQLKIAAFHLCHAANRKKWTQGGKGQILYFWWIVFKLSFHNLLVAKKDFFSFGTFLFLCLLFRMQTLVAKYNSRGDRQRRPIWNFGEFVSNFLSTIYYMQRRNFFLFAHFSSFFFCSRCRHLLPSRAAEETGKEGPFGFWVNFFRPFGTLAEQP